MLPHLVDSLRNGLVLVGERDHAHRLREVGVARRADEQPVGVAARLLHERTEPEPRTIAMPEGICWQLDRVDDRALGFAALAPDPDLGEISAGPSFIDPEGTTAGRSSTVGKGVPVDVADVALLACPHETDRHNGLRFLVPVDELARPGERGPVDQSTRPGLAPRFLSLAALRDKPLGELYRVDPGLPCRSRIVVGGWGGMEHQGSEVQQVLQLGQGTGLVDLVTLGPVFQSADDHRLVGQVEHRARAECHDHLTLPDLTVGFFLFVLGGVHHSSSCSTSALSMVRTQRFTLGSTSRMDRLARKYLCRELISLSSGSRNSWSRGLAAPASRWLYCKVVPWL